jgi:hypothetical protein
VERRENLLRRGFSRDPVFHSNYVSTLPTVCLFNSEGERIESSNVAEGLSARPHNKLPKEGGKKHKFTQKRILALTSMRCLANATHRETDSEAEEAVCDPYRDKMAVCIDVEVQTYVVNVTEKNMDRDVGEHWVRTMPMANGDDTQGDYGEESVANLNLCLMSHRMPPPLQFFHLGPHLQVLAIVLLSLHSEFPLMTSNLLYACVLLDNRLWLFLCLYQLLSRHLVHRQSLASGRSLPQTVLAHSY